MHILYTVQTRTHAGQVRPNNQDALGTVLEWRESLELTEETIQTRGHLFAVADGMGGHAAGEIASRLAIETLFRTYYTSPWRGDPETQLKEAFVAANQAILDHAQQHPERQGMGTTLVAAVYQPETWIIANIGDSRGYLFRYDGIQQVTQDHSWVAEQARQGTITPEQAAHHPLRNIITRSLGNDDQVAPDIFHLPAQPGDILLLCSDGLSNLVSDRDMADILRTYSLDEAAEKLLSLALERGAPDNVTLIMVRLQGEQQRRSRSRLPWLALVLTLLAIGGFLFWNYIRPKEVAMAPTPTQPLTGIATFTPVSSPLPTTSQPAAPAPTPSSPLPSPLPVQPISPSDIVADPLQMQPIPQIQAPGFGFVQGATTFHVLDDGVEMRITHRSREEGKPIVYQAILPPQALDGPWQGAQAIAVGMDASEAMSSPVPAQWVLAPLQDGPAPFVLLWADAQAEKRMRSGETMILYTVNGRGGGDSLGVEVPSGNEGTPIAVVGAWQIRGDAFPLASFQVEEVYDYDPQQDAYRLRQP